MLGGQQPNNAALGNAANPAPAGAPPSRIRQVIIDKIMDGSGIRALIDLGLAGLSMGITALITTTNDAQHHAEEVTSGPTVRDIMLAAVGTAALVEATRASYNATRSQGSMLHKAKEIAIKTGQGAWTGLGMGAAAIAVSATPILNEAQQVAATTGTLLTSFVGSFVLNPRSYRGRGAIRGVGMAPPPAAQPQAGQVAINIAPVPVVPVAPVNPPAVIPVAPPNPPVIHVGQRAIAPRNNLQQPNTAAVNSR